MAVKTIPAQTIKTCDCCGVVIDRGNSRKDASITLRSHALDMQGSPCADATRNLDLCDACAYSVAKAIDDVISAKLSTKAAKQD